MELMCGQRRRQRQRQRCRMRSLNVSLVLHNENVSFCPSHPVYVACQCVTHQTSTINWAASLVMREKSTHNETLNLDWTTCNHIRSHYISYIFILRFIATVRYFIKHQAKSIHAHTHTTHTDYANAYACIIVCGIADTVEYGVRRFANDRPIMAGAFRSTNNK